MLESHLIAELDLPAAVRQELSSRNRLLPPRYDYGILETRTEEVARLLQPRLKRARVGDGSSVVFADKAWRGARPLTVMSLPERVLYRALVEVLASKIPESISARQPFADFQRAPADIEHANYVSKTDIVAFYEYIDHEILEEELVAQTGDEPTVVALIELLQRIMGRRLGIPQVHTASDVLGDAYIDRARRALRRRGTEVFTYSDDFRIASKSLGEARKALSDVAQEVRLLGLVLNERKTFTYRRSRYVESFDSFTRAEEALFIDEQHDASGLTLLRDEYGDDAGEVAALVPQLAREPIPGPIDEEDALVDEGPHADTPVAVNEAQASAARRAWDLWMEEDESDEAQSRHEAAVTQSLLGRALPLLGTSGDVAPLDSLRTILRYEPALTPQVAAYIAGLSTTHPGRRRQVWDALDELVESELLSLWQSMWIAHAAGTVGGRPRASRRHVEWLNQAVETGPDALAATAAGAVALLRRGTPATLSKALDRIGTSWRQLVLWSLARIAPESALDCAEDALDRLLLAAVAA